MSVIKRLKSIGLASMVVAIATVSMGANAQSLSRTYEVTITNVTKAVQFTPILVATHSSKASFFELGERASSGIADVAESGNVAPLKASLDSNSSVAATAQSEGLLNAGDSVTISVKAYPYIRNFSLAAMLLPTNDTFVAIDTMSLPRNRNASVTYHAKAYDAGSEPNDEICANIPGPTCGGEGRSPQDDTSAEGFVHIANGIHGIADVPEELYSWDGPVAKVTVTRTR